MIKDIIDRFVHERIMILSRISSIYFAHKKTLNIAIYMRRLPFCKVTLLSCRLTWAGKYLVIPCKKYLVPNVFAKLTFVYYHFDKLCTIFQTKYNLFFSSNKVVAIADILATFLQLPSTLPYLKTATLTLILIFNMVA